MDFKSRKKQQKDRLLRSRMRTSMSKILGSFTVTAVVGVSAVAFTQSVPKASFEYVELSHDAVFYEGEVIDESTLIVDGSLSIVLQSSLDQRTQTIETGFFSGYFDHLRLNTNYELQVQADYGFGRGVLQRTTFRTPAVVQPTLFAEFSYVETLGTTVDYACFIESQGPSDSTNRTYQLVANTGSSFITQPLLLGFNQGTLQGLNAFTTYTLTIESVESTGTVSLATTIIETHDVVAGRIATPLLTDKEVIGSEYQMMRYYTYTLETTYVDENNELSDVQLLWDSLYWYELNEVMPPEPTANPIYTSIPITSTTQTIDLLSLEGGCRVFLQLVATRGVTPIVLDEFVFDTAPELGASFYLQDTNASSLTFQTYLSGNDFTYYEMSYSLEVSTLQDTRVYSLELTEEDFDVVQEYDYIEVTKTLQVTELQPATHYQVTLVAHYLDVLTNEIVNEVVHEYTYATTAPYVLQTSMQQVDTNLVIGVFLDDPANVFVDNPEMNAFAVFNYAVYTGEDASQYVDSGNLYLNVQNNPATISIDISNGLSPYYTLILYADKQGGNPLDGFIVYSYCEVYSEQIQVLLG